MSEERFDIFLELTPYMIKRFTIQGESTDAKFGAESRFATNDAGVETDIRFGEDDRGGIEIESFDVNFGTAKGRGASSGGQSSVKLTRESADDRGDVDLRQLLAKVNELEKQVAEFEKKLDQPGDADSEGRILNIKKPVDASSITLFRSYLMGVNTRHETLTDAAAGKRKKVRYPEFATGVVTVRKAGGKGRGFLVLTFGNLRVSSYSLNVNDPTPDEEISLKFGQMMMRYRPQSATGTLLETVASTDWDFVKMAPWDDKPS